MTARVLAAMHYWRHSVDMLLSDLVRNAQQAANAASRRPSEFNFAELRKAKRFIDDALSYEERRTREAAE